MDDFALVLNARSSSHAGPTVVNAQVLAGLHERTPYAPLHQPHHLEESEAVSAHNDSPMTPAGAERNPSRRLNLEQDRFRAIQGAGSCALVSFSQF
jgi:hypothetical protein